MNATAMAASEQLQDTIESVSYIEAPAVSARQLAEAAAGAAAEAEAAWRVAFKPHAYLLGTHTRPSQLLFFAITGGAERWLKIPLDLSQPPLSYAALALAVVRRTPVVRYFGATSDSS